jgi:hypothetical protein
MRAQAGPSWKAGALGLLALALGGCGSSAPKPPPEFSPTVSESPTAAGTIMTCDTIASEHKAITESLSHLGISDATTDLQQRDAMLARLAAQKGCPRF